MLFDNRKDNQRQVKEIQAEAWQGIISISLLEMSTTQTCGKYGENIARPENKQ